MAIVSTSKYKFICSYLLPYQRSNIDDIIIHHIIELLKEDHLDIEHDPDFMKRAEYQKYKNYLVPFYHPLYGFTYDYFVNVCILPPQTLMRIKGRFAMNYKLRPEYAPSFYENGAQYDKHEDPQKAELKKADLIREILKFLPDTMDSEDYNTVGKKINRIEIRLKEKLGINFSDYKNEDGLKFKLLYLIYMMENVIYPGKNIIKMLGNPSYENLDLRVFGVNTHNEGIMTDFKAEIRKELHPEFCKRVNHFLMTVTDEIDNLSVSLPGGEAYKNIGEIILKETERLKNIKSSEGRQTILEDFYVELSKNEIYCKITDTKASFQYALDYTPCGPLLDLQASQSLSGRMHDFEETDIYIKKNTEYLAKLIYGSTAATPGKQKKIINMLEPFLFMAEIYISFAQLKQVSDLDIVVIYQCLLFDFDGKKIIYKFHGYSTPVPTMISIIKQRQQRYYMNLKTMYCWILKRRCCSLGIEEQFKRQILLYRLLWDYADVLLSHRNIDRMAEDFFTFYPQLLRIMEDKYNVYAHPLADVIYSLSGYKLKFDEFKDYSILRTLCRECEDDLVKISGTILSVLKYPERKYYQLPVRLSQSGTIELNVIFNHERKVIILNTDLEYDAVEQMVLYHALHNGYIPSWDFDDELLKRIPPFQAEDFI